MKTPLLLLKLLLVVALPVGLVCLNRSGHIAQLVGNDSWAVESPPDSDVSVSGRPRQLIVDHASRAEALKIAGAYWLSEGKTTSGRPHIQPAAMSRDEWSQYTILCKTCNEGVIDVLWTPPDSPPRSFRGSSFELDEGRETTR